MHFQKYETKLLSGIVGAFYAHNRLTTVSSTILPSGNNFFIEKSTSAIYNCSKFVLFNIQPAIKAIDEQDAEILLQRQQDLENNDGKIFLLKNICEKKLQVNT